MGDLLDLCYCQAARQSARFLTRLYDRHLAPVGVNIQQFSILGTVAKNPGILIADLADRMVMERTTLVRALKPLRESGLITSASSGVGRSLALSVTRHGFKVIVEGMPLWKEAQREFEELFGSSEAAVLRKEMQKASVVA
jgi:DNA-binding MarR family transcriptional regulator